MSQNHPSIKAFIEYSLAKSANNVPLHSTLQNLLGSAGLASSNHVGFIFCERLVNMPVQVIPHMYRMLVDEIKWAVEEVRLSSVICLAFPPSPLFVHD